MKKINAAKLAETLRIAFVSITFLGLIVSVTYVSWFA
jgi:hypothetical protein